MASEKSPLVNLTGDLEEFPTTHEFYIKIGGNGDELKILNTQEKEMFVAFYGHNTTFGIMTDSKGPRFKISDTKGCLLWQVLGEPQVELLGYRSTLEMKVVDQAGTMLGLYEGDKLCFKVLSPTREELFKVERGLISHTYKITSPVDSSVKGKIKEEFQLLNVKSHFQMPPGLPFNHRVLLLAVAIEATAMYFASNQKTLGK